MFIRYKQDINNYSLCHFKPVLTDDCNIIVLSHYFQL